MINTTIIGARSFASFKKNKDKVVETSKNVRGKMRQIIKTLFNV